MRRNGWLGVAVVLLLLAAVFLLLGDVWVENQIEEVGSASLGAAVEIDDLDLHLLTPGVDLARFQVANPLDTWRNLVETGAVHVAIEAAPLLRKKLVIDAITVAGLRVNNRRETDGAVATDESAAGPAWVEESRDGLRAQVGSAPLAKLARVLQGGTSADSLLAALDVRSPERLRGVGAGIDAAARRWQGVVDDLDPGAEIRRLQADLDSVRAQLEGLDDAASLQQLPVLRQLLVQLATRLDSLRQQLVAHQRRARSDFQSFDDQLGQVDDWIAADLQNLRRQMGLEGLSPDELSRALVGPSVADATVGLLRYVALAREYMPVARKLTGANKLESPPRFAGQNIRFPLRDPVPDLLIRRIAIGGSAGGETLQARGTITGLTSHPRLYGEPATLELEANLEGIGRVQLDGVFDHTAEVARDRLHLRAQGLRLADLELHGGAYLPTRVIVPQADIDGTLEMVGADIDLRLTVTGTGITFDFGDSAAGPAPVQRAVRRSLEGVNRLELSAEVRGRSDDLDLRLRSNLGQQLADGFGQLANESEAALRHEVRQRLRTQVEAQREQILSRAGDARDQVLSRLETALQEVGGETELAEQVRQQLRARAEEAGKGQLQDLGRRLKDMF